MKKFLFLAATAAALLFSGCETPGDDNDNNQNNSENVDNGDNNNDNENENNNQDQDYNNGDDPAPAAPSSLVGTMWSARVDRNDEYGETGTEVATIFFDDPNQVTLMSQFSDPDGNVIETDTFPGTYTYEIPVVTIYYSVDYGDEEGIVNYILTGTVDGYVMTLSREDSNGEVYTITFTRE